MKNSPIIVVDADAIVAQASPSDSLHAKSAEVAILLVQHNARVLYPVTAIIEATTHIQRVLANGQVAYSTVLAFIDSNINVVEVNQEIMKHALQFFSSTTSKKNTFYDCIVAEIARKYKADAIFSFDRFYKKNGFMLASEFIHTSI